MRGFGRMYILCKWVQIRDHIILCGPGNNASVHFWADTQVSTVVIVTIRRDVAPILLFALFLQLQTLCAVGYGLVSEIVLSWWGSCQRSHFVPGCHCSDLRLI